MREKIRNAPNIPDHEVLRKIGGGAYGDVWMAQAVTGVMRAIKVVWREDFDIDVDFEREFEGIKNYEPISRSNQGLIPILHVGRSKKSDENTFYYYVMELADDVDRGQSFHPVEYIPRTLLSDLRIADKKSIDVDRCLKFGRQTAEALAFLHSKGLAHRDIKPANIVYHNGAPKLADIGLVAAPGQRTFVGTQGFVPPEGPGTRRADIYALGKILYEMTTGKDRMDFPQLPECPFNGEKAKRWKELNTIICDVCDAREPSRNLKQAEPLVKALDGIARGRGYRKPLPLAKFKPVALGASLLLAGALLVMTLRPERVEDAKEEAFVPVKITSLPAGAEVWTTDGEFIGTTPLAGREVMEGTITQYEFRLNGYATVREDLIAQGPAVILEAVLPIFAPPQKGAPWSDALGAPYTPKGNGHIAKHQTFEWAVRHFPKGEGPSKYKFGAGTIRVNGVNRMVALTDQKGANAYCVWLTRLSLKRGYLTEDFQIKATLDKDSKVSKASPGAKKNNLVPFVCYVEGIPYSSLAAKFTGAVEMALFIDGVQMDYELNDGVLLVDKIRPGKHVITVEAEGYRQYTKKYEFKNNELAELNLKLRANNSVVFDNEWENSMGMIMKPINEVLMASAYETRIDDYLAFCKATERAQPGKPSFKQEGEHPVVNVSRADAQEFCKWLTEKERKESRIGSVHAYRLPTDEEWSYFAELENETGQTPFERDVAEGSSFEWGEDWPPSDSSGNFADETHAAEEVVLRERVIEGYYDFYSYTAPVGGYEGNGYGLSDMAGNVYEWVSDDFGVGEYGVARGASWKSYQKDSLLLKFRNAMKPTAKNDETGFRVVLSKSE